MKTGILCMIWLLAFHCCSAQKRTDLGNYFLLKGKLLLIDPFTEAEGETGSTQVVVFQGDEIFVSFDSKTSGKYEFYLPVGHVYTIRYGGGKFVNKKVILDATTSPREKKPRSMNLDIGLFRPIDGASFPTLEQPYVKIAYNSEYDDFVPDFEHTDAMMKQLTKEIKMAKKSRTKPNKPSPTSKEEPDKEH
jgi:hypothetical protein